MADPNPPSAAAGASNAPAGYKAGPNPALRMMGISKLPTKLPSRNWMIFWTLTGALSAAIMYDKREKKRATARWSKSVAHLAKEPLTNPNQLPRRLTIYLESPPTDGLRVAQDHFTEYMKPVLASSGLDWEFVQGRKEGDIRAAVAEKIRRRRRETEDPAPIPNDELTADEIIRDVRRRNGTPEWTGINGDIVIGRHTWKEYIRGLHEGWLGPLSAPQPPENESLEAAEKPEGSADEKKEEKPDEKPARPPQPLPHNTPNDYPTSSLPRLIPAEFSPSSPITFPHILGFSNTFTRLRRFLNRRHLADDIGREVAAVCLAHAREYHEGNGLTDSEQQAALEKEERDWPKSVWKQTQPKQDEETSAAAPPPTERIWTESVVMDPRIAMRMRRFEVQTEDEARAKGIVVPEEEIEGWLKGSLRNLYRWATSDPPPKPYWSDE